tara:strand:+ start:69 stop:215 length:147 start_codon:yes stop_codon:yes gene_type:complete
MGRTKTQKKRLAYQLRIKSKALFFEDLISASEVQTISRIAKKVENKLK